MLVISQDQINLFNREKLLHFFDEVIIDVRKRFKSRVMDTNEQLKKKYDGWFLEAKQFDITKKREVSIYLQLCTVNFDIASPEKPPWILQILENNKLTPKQKVEALYNTIILAKK